MKHWQSVSGRPGERRHIAHVYRDDEFMVDALVHFVQGGLVEGEGVVVFAARQQWEGCVCRLASRGVALHDAEMRGQLAVLDPRTVLSSFMADGMPDWKAFQDVVGTVINLTRRRYQRVRAYGGMADLLWERGQHAAALRLEALWNHLIKVQDLVLCCAYHIDTLNDESYASPLQDLFGLHTHLIPARDCDAFEATVQRANEVVLGPRLASMLRSLASARHPVTEMPDAQSTILWMQRHMPITARKVLSCARRERRETRCQRIPADRIPAESTS